MSTLLDILRDIFFRSMSSVALSKIVMYIEKNCQGCREPGDYYGKQYHNICELMSWESQVIEFLPGILKEITPSEISEAMRTTYKYDKRKETLKKMLLSKRGLFSLRTFLYICFKDMCRDEHLQTRIAQDVYASFDAPDADDIQLFGKQYQEAITPGDRRDSDVPKK